jgi:hypothetical protein
MKCSSLLTPANDKNSDKPREGDDVYHNMFMFRGLRECSRRARVPSLNLRNLATIKEALNDNTLGDIDMDNIRSICHMYYSVLSKLFE